MYVCSALLAPLFRRLCELVASLWSDNPPGNDYLTTGDVNVSVGLCLFFRLLSNAVSPCVEGGSLCVETVLHIFATALTVSTNNDLELLTDCKQPWELMIVRSY